MLTCLKALNITNDDPFIHIHNLQYYDDDALTFLYVGMCESACADTLFILNE